MPSRRAVDGVRGRWSSMPNIDELSNMMPGDILLAAPIDQIIQKLGVGIAEAQLRLDQAAVKVATMLSQARVEIKDVLGNTTTKSLLELGFMPSFYHFAESEIEVRMTIQIQVGEDQRATLKGSPIELEYHRKHQFDVNGSSLIRTKLITVPAPALFLDLLREQARTGGSISQPGGGDSGGGDGDSGGAQNPEPDPQAHPGEGEPQNPSPP
jgi:hypothetical protein